MSALRASRFPPARADWNADVLRMSVAVNSSIAEPTAAKISCADVDPVNRSR
jgi:hypothetical protein